MAKGYYQSTTVKGNWLPSWWNNSHVTHFCRANVGTNIEFHHARSTRHDERATAIFHPSVPAFSGWDVGFLLHSRPRNRDRDVRVRQRHTRHNGVEGAAGAQAQRHTHGAKARVGCSGGDSAPNPRGLGAYPRGTEDGSFEDLLKTVEDNAIKNELWIQAAPGWTPTIIVPRSCQELLIRDTHSRMHHLNHVKVFAVLKRSYVSPDMRKDTNQEAVGKLSWMWAK